LPGVNEADAAVIKSVQRGAVTFTAGANRMAVGLQSSAPSYLDGLGSANRSPVLRLSTGEKIPTDKSNKAQ